MKTKTNVSIEKEIFEASKLEEEAWKEENKSRISTYNDYITENGVFSDDNRMF